MKRTLLMMSLIITFCCGSALASSSGPSIPADEAMKLLKEGNARYVAGQPLRANQGPERRAETVKGGQHPVATIIGCSDSRAPLEILFDQGVGDIFVIRVAGNLAGPDELATVEYGVGHLGTPVLLVLGHTACGAVTAAVQNAKVHGHIPLLINQIKPAVAKAKAWSPGAQGDDLVNKSIKANVWVTMENILRKSHEVNERVKKGQLLLVGGIYDLHTGAVTWLGQHPEQGKLLSAGSGHGMAKPMHKAAAPAADKAAAEGVLPPADPHAATAPKAGAAHQ